jgi:hypothetical protein
MLRHCNRDVHGQVGGGNRFTFVDRLRGNLVDGLRGTEQALPRVLLLLVATVELLGPHIYIYMS